MGCDHAQLPHPAPHAGQRGPRDDGALQGPRQPAGATALEIAFGINTHQSLLGAYFTYLGNVARGRFGTSLTFFPDAVTHEVLQALPWTLGLVGVTTILAFILGTLVGLVAGWRRGGILDGLLPPIFVITSAFPYFWLALLSIWLFAIKLGWFPESGGYNVTTNVAWSWTFVGDALRHSILPALTILVTSIGGWILTMRNNMIAVLSEDYVRMARAKGLSPWRIMWTYAGRNAILPNLTGFAMSLGFVVSGAILVEFVFNYPGVGWMFLQAVENQDYALMQGPVPADHRRRPHRDPRGRRGDGAARPAHAGEQMSARRSTARPSASARTRSRPRACGVVRPRCLGCHREQPQGAGRRLLVIFLVVALFPGQIAPYDPTAEIFLPAPALVRTTGWDDGVRPGHLLAAHLGDPASS